MKKSLHIIALAVLAFALNVKAIASELILKSANKNWFTARLDNGPLTAPSGRVEFKNVPAGYHRIVLFGHTQPFSPVAQVLFDNMVYIPEGVTMKTVLKPNGSLVVAEVRPFHQNHGPYTPYQPVPPAPNYYGYYGHNGPVNNGAMFSPADFEMLRNTISNQSFDDTRLTIAKQAIQNRMLSTSQVRQLMDLFIFESTKLNLAKYAYQYVYDRNNYFQVNDAFTFSSTIDELNNFIVHNG